MQFNSATGAYGWNFIPPAGTFGDCDVSGGACDPAGNIIFSGYFSLQIDFWSGHRHYQSYSCGCWREWRIPCQVPPNRQLVWAKSATLFVIILHQHLLTVYWRIVTAMYTGQGHVSEHLFPNIRPMELWFKIILSQVKDPTVGIWQWTKWIICIFQINYYDSCHTGTDTFYANNGSEALFCKFRNDGRYDWAARLYNPDRDDQATTIDVDRKGNIYTLGNFSDTIDVDASNAVYNLTAPSGFHVYLCQIRRRMCSCGHRTERRFNIA